MKIIKDQLGREFSVSKNSKRIISLVPSQTELLCDLNLENELVGITKFCVHPYQLKSTKTIVGGTKKVDFEKIKALKPDFILCNKEENTFEMVAALEKIAPTYISEVNTIEDALDLIKNLGEILDRKAISQDLIEKINVKLYDFKEFIKTKPTRKVAYFIWAKPWMVAANHTFINEMLLLNKFENIYQNKERYPEVYISKIKAEGNPSVIILSSEPFPFKEIHAAKIETYANLSKIFFADGELFSWFGSRLLKSFDYFKELHLKIENGF